jgi:hypothetical protein
MAVSLEQPKELSRVGSEVGGQFWGTGVTLFIEQLLQVRQELRTQHQARF